MKAVFRKLPLFVLTLLIAQLAVGAAVVEGAPPAAEPIIHIVRRGETLTSIAWRYGTRIAAIAQANNLANYNLLYVGQRLIIPSRESPRPKVYIVRRGDTLSTIALRYGTTADAIAQANQIRNPQLIYVGQRLLIPTGDASPSSTPPQTGIHVVRRGETLTQIALRYRTTIQAIVAANNLANPSLLYAGQRLVIPLAHAPTTRSAPRGQKWIDINLTTQTLVAYEGDRPVLSTLVSTGKAGTPTPTGRFRIREKYRYRDMAGGRGASRYHYRNVPHVMFFHGSYSLHGTYWHSNFGHPMSHGCVNMSLRDAEWLFNWAPLGTLVVVHR